MRFLKCLGCLVVFGGGLFVGPTWQVLDDELGKKKNVGRALGQWNGMECGSGTVCVAMFSIVGGG